MDYRLIFTRYVKRKYINIKIFFAQIYLWFFTSTYPNDNIWIPNIYLSILISIYLYIYLSIHLSIYPSIHLSIHPSIHLSIYSRRRNVYSRRRNVYSRRRSVYSRRRSVYSRRSLFTVGGSHKRGRGTP